MPWIPSREDFDDYQERILSDILIDEKNSWWLQGYPGTGKTMLLIHLIAEYVNAGWDCAFVTFTHALRKLAIEGMKELGHKPGQLHIETVDKLNVLKRRYDIIFVDEVQDLRIDQIRKLQGLSNRFVYAGDLNQSIFLQAAPSGSIRESLGKPKVVELTDLYRMPEPVFMAANIIYPEAKIKKGAQVSTSISSSINLVAADSESSEVEWVYRQAKNESRKKLPSAILFGKHKDLQRFIYTLLRHLGEESPEVVGKDYDPLNKHLRHLKLPIMYYGGAHGGDLESAGSSPKILLMTVQSAKGLEFGSVFTPFMNQGNSLSPYDSKLKNESWQRRNLFVAITRTKLNFYASYSKILSDLLHPLAPEYVSVTLENNDQNSLIKYFKHYHVES